MQEIKSIIFSNLVKNESYSRKVIPFLKSEYFKSRTDKFFFDLVSDFILKYNNLPTKEVLGIMLDKLEGISEEEISVIGQLIEDSYKPISDVDQIWLIDETEKFCKDSAVYNAIMESINIIDGKSKSDSGAIPDILSKALAVSFDSHIGHDYIEDAEQRYNFYHTIEQKTGFDLEYFNLITNGGTPAKTLNIVMAATGVGKSLFLCHHAANCLKQNQNVLYITCEMAEERIAERIDANLLDITMDDLKKLPKSVYDKRIENLSEVVTGKLIIKEYPTATANANHFRFLLDELWLKKRFKPDIIFIDYLNICSSSRLKNANNANSYTYIKAIAEELRGLAVEYNVPVFSATQVNRTGYKNSDIGLEDTSESFGLPATADFMFAMISNDELDEMNQILIKQLKNRYNDTVTNRKFLVGINRSKMKLFDVKRENQTVPISTEKIDLVPKRIPNAPSWNF